MNRELSWFIRTKALEIGFSKVGITRAEYLAEEGSHLNEWLRRGYHATMAWMQANADKRADIRKVFPNAKSIVCVALNYYTDVQHSDEPGTGKISRYAWGDDYHRVMTERLTSLLADICTFEQGLSGKVYVDTGPVMDKVWAARAGLGWQGKHTNLITKDFGSWVFLGEILLDVELEYDEPVTDMCGTCTACIDACPTDAITEPYVVDSNKCISYLTIEHRGSVPQDLARSLEGWIYGCDICQDVCPWNRFQQPTSESLFEPRPWNQNPELEKIEKLTPEEFTERYRRSPIKRAKLEGLVRNARAISGSG